MVSVGDDSDATRRQWHRRKPTGSHGLNSVAISISSVHNEGRVGSFTVSVANVIIQQDADGICMNVRVIARARKTELAGTRDDALLVRLNAPPVDGAANEELVSFIASLLGVPRRNVAILSGARSRHKRLRVSGIDPATAAVHLRCT